MKKTIFSLVAIILVITACSKEGIDIDPENPIIGTWNFAGYSSNTEIFTRSNEFIENHCFRFLEDGTLVERKNTGFCGTPPVTYGNYTGTWSPVNDTLILIRVGSWGGPMSYTLDIDRIDREALWVTQVIEE